MLTVAICMMPNTELSFPCVLCHILASQKRNPGPTWATVRTESWCKYDAHRAFVFHVFSRGKIRVKRQTTDTFKGTSFSQKETICSFENVSAQKYLNGSLQFSNICSPQLSKAKLPCWLWLVTANCDLAARVPKLGRTQGHEGSPPRHAPLIGCQIGVSSYSYMNYSLPASSFNRINTCIHRFFRLHSHWTFL